VALKTRARGVLHKSDVGGVRVGLTGGAEVSTAYAEMQQRIGEAMEGAVVQRMAGDGLEVIVGITQDALFGPLLLFGLGGVNAELLADRSLRILPLTDVDAHELVRSLRSSPLLFGYRGAPALDVGALEALLLRVARLATDVPEITEMDLNPVIVHEDGVSIVDVRARCQPVPAAYPSDLRRMRD
jgi:acyl-CoA synthetase (NDP forming)